MIPRLQQMAGLDVFRTHAGVQHANPANMQDQYIRYVAPPVVFSLF